MTEITKANEERKEKSASRTTVEVIAVLFFLLNLASSLVIMLLPFKEKVLGGLFTGQPAPYRGLWMLFTVSLVLMILLNALSAPKERRRDYWKFFGTINVIVGFLCAIEIFYLHATRNRIPHDSLWRLMIVLTVLGAIGVYLTKKLETLDLEETRKKDEALAKKRKTIPTVVRLKVRRYYVSESKTVACDN